MQIFELDRSAKNLGLDDELREDDDYIDSKMKMRSKDYSKAKKVVKLLKKLLLE